MWPMPRADISRTRYLRRLVGPQHGQRQADLVVERAFRRDGRAEALDHLGGEVLGRGLARRPGDADDGRVGQPAEDGAREHAEGDGDVGDDDDRCPGLGQRPGGEDGGRALRGGGGGVVVAVHVLAGQRGEQRARYRLPRVDHDRAGHHRVGRASPESTSRRGDRGDLGDGQRDHAGHPVWSPYGCGSEPTMDGSLPHPPGMGSCGDVIMTRYLGLRGGPRRRL